MAEGTQQHPLKIYFYVWTLLFVFSAFSYWVDWYGFESSIDIEAEKNSFG